MGMHAIQCESPTCAYAQTTVHVHVHVHITLADSQLHAVVHFDY